MKRFTGFFDILKGAFRARFQPATLSADRTITLADKTGTLAVLETSGSTATSIKLDGFTSYPSLTVTGAISFTAASGAVAGGEATVRLIANGSNVPTFGSFKKRSDSRSYVNTNGTVNVILFNFDGVDYWYRVWQESATSVTADDLVALTGNQTIAGDKTLSGSTTFNGKIANIHTAATNGNAIISQTINNEAIEIRGYSTANSPAFVMFHRPTQVAWFFGLDTDNQFTFGGGSGGATYAGVKMGGLTVINAAAGSPFRVTLNTPPANNATGTAGEIRWGTDGAIYLCVSTNSWRKVALSTY